MFLDEEIAGLPALRELHSTWEGCQTVEIGGLVGSSYAMAAAAAVRKQNGIHLFVSDDKDTAAYLCNDLYKALDPERVMFLPTGYKRSIQYGQEDSSGLVQRTATLAAVKNHKEGYLAICTYPEALVERVAEMEELRKNTLIVTKCESVSPQFIAETLTEYGFARVDFVHEPGQFAQRGGIVDVFSFAENRPFRLDFFGDELESIRTFEVGSQLSVDKLETAEIVPNLSHNARLVSLAEYVGSATWWINDLDYTLKRLTAIRSQIFKEDPERADQTVIGSRSFLGETAEQKFILRHAPTKERQPECTIDFGTTPQPAFNKQFELLAENLKANKDKGYTTYILSENKAQIERLRNIFNSLGFKDVPFTPVPATLHAGFVSHALRAAVYTDHQIFDRYHRYKLNRELDRSEALTVAELNALQVGDYVVHIDHGVGRFGGLVKLNENGHLQEAIKLVYRDNDVLFVNVHALHRISRYKDKDAEPPKVYKLGSGAWQRMKAATKKAVKDIARELTALYARRKAAGGFAFSPDTFMQQELEASFIYEDTPDQQKATEAVKRDMESPHPMDRLVCGDVGFGKTEVAMRAAFKAVTDGKQVAVLVPTTILALQHYRTFNDRLKEFPVRIEHLSRARSTSEVRALLKELTEGKIDILVGTHKILGKEVKFKDLGLLIIDEEQKFGVSAKEKLRELSVSVDTLTLTATPIPRTLQFSLMGSRDMSVITTPPPNRYPVQTESHLFDKEIIKEALEYELARHGQAYFVHNRVEDIGKIAATLQELVPGLKVVVAHGQMEPKEMERRVMDFIYGEYDVLLATSIIENGIDIANANTIIINNAQNFGLSDLHQLRGRVGRSNRKAFCYLLSPPDEMLGGDARRRLRAIEEFSDLGAGFNIAMQDLDIRGAGNLLGAEQSGFIADIGFETYQKILDEAMDELRAEGVLGQGEVGGDVIARSEQRGNLNATDEQLHTRPSTLHTQRNWLSDAHIEVDTEAMLPDDYVGSALEKIRLYKELDGITDERDLQRFHEQLTDRFGTPPAAVEELLSVIRLRHIMMRLGFERAKVKNGLLILRFVADQNSPYYKSQLFMHLLQRISGDAARFVLKQRDGGLGLTVRNVPNTAAAVQALRAMVSD